MSTPNEILDFWYSKRIKKYWFAATPAVDKEIRERFEAVWQLASRDGLDEWRYTAEGCLALVIILDQFPLNMFRGTASSFSTGTKAIAVARHAIERNFDESISSDKLAFLYMPLIHSENLKNQDDAIELFQKPGMEANLKFARHHRKIIHRFCRFPHRNAILGRTSTQEELDYLDSEEAFRG